MPTLQGKWYFKETLVIEPSLNISISTDVASFKAGGEQYLELVVAGSDSGAAGPLVFLPNMACPYGYYSDSNGVGAWEKNTNYRSIEFFKPVEVSEEFYNWFTKNAVPLTIEGTWRFNAHLTINSGYIVEGLSYQVDGESYLYDGLYIYDDPTEGQVILYKDPEYSKMDWRYYSGAPGWLKDNYRIITFTTINNLPSDFALWFYENAHPTEVVICSEAYVAEIAHNIRQIKGTTQKYAVKNLANEIRNLYINANEEVY
jgi:hypothetical protein